MSTLVNAAPLVWNTSYDTGVEEIDEQHQILVHMLNEVNAKLSDASKHDLLDSITRDLLSYAIYHFETEEQLMDSSAYIQEQGEDAALHMQQHRTFSARVLAIREGIKSGRHVPRDELLSFLNNWLIDHILNTDKKLAAHLLAQGQTAQPDSRE